MFNIWTNYSTWFIRLISLTVAVTLWFYVYNLDRADNNIIMDIEFRNPPAHLYTDFKYSGQTVTAHISGNKDDVQEARQSLDRINYIVDLKNAGEGENTFKIKREETPAIKKILSKVNPTIKKKTIKILFQKIVIKKDIPVVLNIDNKQTSEYKVAHIKHNPRKVKIRGPESKIAKIKKVRSKLYTIKGKEHSYKTTIPFEDLPKAVDILSAKNISISISIINRIRNHKIRNIKVIGLENLKSKLTIVENNLKLDYIILRGTVKAIKKIDPENIRGYISVANLTKPGEYNLEVMKIDLGPFAKDVEIVEQSPKKLKITIKKIE